MSLKRRIIAGMGANAYGQGISIITQLATLPLFLSHWDLTRYGIWLMLTSIPSYFSVADGGIVNAARNEMTIALGSGDESHANRVFQSTLIFLLAMTGLVLLVLALLLFGTPLFDSVLESEYKLVLFILVCGIFLSFVNGLSEATFSSVGKYGMGTTIGHSIRLAEWGGGVVGLLAVGSFTGVAGGMLVLRALGVMISIFLGQKYSGVFVWGFRHARMEQFRATIKPALYFLIFPLSGALSIQGFTLLVGSVLGAASVAVFNTYRTLARLIVQATSIFSHSVGPELSRLFGAQQFEQYHHLFRRSQFISVALVILTSVVVALLGPWILQIWTHGRIQYSGTLMWPMLLYATVVGVAHMPRILLMSINRHSSIALASIAVYSMSLAVAYLMGGMLDLTGIILVMAAGEFGLVLITIYYAESEMRRPLVGVAC